MSGRPQRETIMAALYAALVASAQTSFSANTAANNIVLGAPSSLAGLFVGLPVFGANVPRGSVIATLSPSLTLTLPPTSNAVGVAMTTGFMTTGRRLVMWDQCQAQPALFLRDGSREDLSYQGSLQVQTLSAEVWIYANAGENPDAVPATALNNLLDAVQAAFAPDDPGSGRYTIGGLVEWCRLEGRVDKDPGDLGGQALAVMDVLITVP